VKRILCIDGGGLMGIIPAEFLKEVEALIPEAGMTLSDYFDLVSGSSTGAVICAMIAKGETALDTARLYAERGPGLFAKARSRNWWVSRPRKGKFKREVFREEFRQWIGDLTMGELKTLYMATSVSITDGTTHYFKSDDDRVTEAGRVSDAALKVLDVVARSGLSAPYYFDPLDDPDSKHVWIDGGTGTQNCNLEECIIEAIRREWDRDEKVRILSLGTGYAPLERTFKKTAKWSSTRTIRDYLQMARRRSIPNQLKRWQEGWSKVMENVDVLRVDVKVPKEINVLDGAKHAAEYVKYGKKLAADFAEQVIEFLGVS
jgi:patatin-like phospholipase/acyl hydrolase